MTDLKTPWSASDWSTLNGPMSTISNGDKRLLAVVASDEYENLLDADGVSRVARLMAAAPEMYEALKELWQVSFAPSGEDIGRLLQAVKKAEAALAKAKDESDEQA